MEVSSSHQLFVFVLCILSGVACGVFFDVQRSIRKVLEAGKIRTLFEDLLFALICTAAAIIVAFCFNRGEMRYYQVLGFVGGVLFYAAFLSSLTVKILIRIYKLLELLIINPALLILRIIMLPFAKIFLILKRIYIKINAYLRKFSQRLKEQKKKLKKRMKML